VPAPAVTGAARTPVESTVVVYDGSNCRHKLIRPMGGSSRGHRGLAFDAPGQRWLIGHQPTDKADDHDPGRSVLAPAGNLSGVRSVPLLPIYGEALLGSGEPERLVRKIFQLL
jgi:hypothetical protein